MVYQPESYTASLSTIFARHCLLSNRSISYSEFFKKMVNSNGEKPHYNYFLLTAREGNVFTSVCQSFCSQSASWLLDHCSSFLRHGQYWNAFLLQHEISSWICFIFVRSDAFKFQPFQKAVSTREEHFAELVQKQKRNVHCKIPPPQFWHFL